MEKSTREHIGFGLSLLKPCSTQLLNKLFEVRIVYIYIY